MSTPPRHSDSLYRDLLAPDEVNAVRHRTRKVADDVVAPAASRIANGNERVDGGCWRA